jgi:ATP-dependent Clp protease ATP-binding subunit ClpC
MTDLVFSTSAKILNEDENTKSVIKKALTKTFSPEFLNRIDDVLIFNSLEKNQIHQIIDIILVGVFKRLSDLGYIIELTEQAKDFISDKGYDPQFGARPLHRAIQKYLEDPLAEEILNQNIESGDFILADVDNDKLTFKVNKSIDKVTKEG